jgi:D-psicose/D-tagatose/L-ribulose 3-epimerase
MTARAEPRISLGYSSLGLPPAADAREWAAQLDVVLDQAGFDLVELHPPRLDPDARTLLARRARAVTARGAALVLGLGARHMLSPTKHEPSLICADETGRARRVALLAEAVPLAAELGSGQLIFLSGPSPELCRAGPRKYADPAWARLLAGLERLLELAAREQVVLALEAHSGHLVASVADINRLHDQLGSEWLGFTADTLHQTIVEPHPLAQVYLAAAPRISHVQLDNTDAAPDSRGPVSHRLVDEPGRVDVDEVFAGLIAGRFAGCVSIEFLASDPYAAEVDALAYCRRIGPWLRAKLDHQLAAAQGRPQHTKASR